MVMQDIGQQQNGPASQAILMVMRMCVCNWDIGGERPFAILEDTNPRCTYRPRLVIFLLDLKSSKDPHS